LIRDRPMGDVVGYSPLAKILRFASYANQR